MVQVRILTIHKLASITLLAGRSPISLHTRILPRWNPNITTWWPNGSSWCWKSFTPVVTDYIIIPTRLILLIYDSDNKTQNYNQSIIHLVGIDIMQTSRVPQPTIHDLNVGLIISPLFTQQIWTLFNDKSTTSALHTVK